MKLESTKSLNTQFCAVLRNAMQSSELHRITDYTTCIIQNKVREINFTFRSHHLHVSANW